MARAGPGLRSLHQFMQTGKANFATLFAPRIVAPFEKTLSSAWIIACGPRLPLER
jgi:hypothetical protein